jgi:hypothetical protein
MALLYHMLVASEALRAEEAEALAEAKRRRKGRAVR